MEQNITFRAGDLVLEGLLQKSSATQGVVIAHPHPLYGGDMENPVVETMGKAFGQKAYTTLKLNFRGVGSSQGTYDNGRGEQRDILAAIEHLTDMGMTRIDLSGYSFGAWVISLLKDLPETVGDILLVSPPVAMMPFAPTPAMERVKGIITGSADAIAPVTEIKKTLLAFQSKAELAVIAGADHFYGGHFHSLANCILSIF
jgi:alpha/beta superfamily hydrolase